MDICRNVIYSKTDLSSCLRHAFGYTLFSSFEVPEWHLICWQIAFRSYMSSYMAFKPQIWNCLVPPGKFQVLVSNYFFILCQFQENWLARFGTSSCVKLALFGLLCAWRRVRILHQHTFWHAQWDTSSWFKMPDIHDVMDVTINDLSPEQ
jgi:hypothetical protein